MSAVLKPQIESGCPLSTDAVSVVRIFEERSFRHESWPKQVEIITKNRVDGTNQRAASAKFGISEWKMSRLLSVARLPKEVRDLAIGLRGTPKYSTTVMAEYAAASSKSKKIILGLMSRGDRLTVERVREILGRKPRRPGVRSTPKELLAERKKKAKCWGGEIEPGAVLALEYLKLLDPLDYPRWAKITGVSKSALRQWVRLDRVPGPWAWEKIKPFFDALRDEALPTRAATTPGPRSRDPEALARPEFSAHVLEFAPELEDHYRDNEFRLPPSILWAVIRRAGVECHEPGEIAKRRS